MTRRTLGILPNAETTPAQAIDMAYEFAACLRKTGWLLSDEAYAQSLWVEREYPDSALLPYLVAGFSAGYLAEEKPVVADVGGTRGRAKPAFSDSAMERLSKITPLRR